MNDATPAAPASAKASSAAAAAVSSAAATADAVTVPYRPMSVRLATWPAMMPRPWLAKRSANHKPSMPKLSRYSAGELVKYRCILTVIHAPTAKKYRDWRQAKNRRVRRRIAAGCMASATRTRAVSRRLNTATHSSAPPNANIAANTERQPAAAPSA